MDERLGKLPPNEVRHADEIAGEEIKILEDEQHCAGREYAQDEQRFASRSPALFEVYSSDVINADGNEQDKDVGRDKGHVENATDGQEHRHALPLRQAEK